MRKERKTSKSKTFKRVIAGVVTSTLAISSISLPAFAGSSGVSGGSGLSGGGSYNGYDVVGIFPSALTESSTASDLDNVTKRYYQTSFAKYPVLFKVGGNDKYSDISKRTIMVTSDKAYNKPIYSDGVGYINDVIGSSAYNKLSSDKQNAIKFFRDEIRSCINKDSYLCDESVNSKDCIGTNLNNKFGIKSSYTTDANKRNKFILGYQETVKILYPDKSGSTTVGEKLANAMSSSGSFLVDKYFGLGGNDKLFSSAFVSSYFCQYSNLEHREFDSCLGSGSASAGGFQNLAVNARVNGQPAPSSWSWLISNYPNNIKNSTRAIYPTVNGSPVKVGSVSTPIKSSYGGWGFYELAHSGGKDTFYADTELVKSGVTYNAYLGKDTSVSEKAKFGENGLVSSDLVSLSDIVKYDDLGRTSIFNVDKSIILDTPYADAKFNLSKLQYRVTNPQGSIILNSGGNTDSYPKEKKCALSLGRTKTIMPSIQSAKDTKKNSSDSTNSYACIYKLKDPVGVSNGVSANLEKNYPSHRVNGKVTKFHQNTSYDYKRLLNQGVYATLNGLKGTDGKVIQDLDSGGRAKLYIYASGSWYYCPVIASTSVFVEVRADYLHTYKENDVSKPATMKPYLLAQNFSLESDFTTKKMRTMIDAYPTTLWGAIQKRTNSTTLQDNTKVDMYNPVFFTEGGKGTTTYMGFVFNDTNYKEVTSSSLSNRSGRQVRQTERGSVLTLSKPSNAIISKAKDSSGTWKQKLQVNGYLAYFLEDVGLAQTLFVGTDSIEIMAGSSTVKNMVNFSGVTGNVLFKGRSAGGFSNNKYTSTFATSLKGAGKTSDSGTPSYTPNEIGTINVNSSSSVSANIAGKYKQSEFAKLVATYSSTARFTKGKQAKDLAPNVANWISLSNTIPFTDLGLEPSATGKFVNKTKPKTTVSMGYGYARLGKQGTYVYNNLGNPLGVADVDLSNKTTSSAVEDFKNSSVDIPLRVKWEQYFTGERKSTTTSTIGSTLKVNPEVTMWYQSTTGSYGSVVTAGDYIRNIPIVPYNTLTVKNNSSDPKVTGTSVALDARAKTLASRLADENTPVLYSGSGVTLTYDKVPNVELTSYMLDIDDSRSNLKSAWGNKYSAETSVRTMVSNADAKADIKSDLTVNDQKLTLKELNNCSLKAGDSKLEETWHLTVKGGEVTNVRVNGQNYGSGSFSAGSGKAHEIGVALKEMKLIGDNNILSQVFAKGAGEKITDSGLKTWLTNNGGKKYLNKGWYYEDTSVLVVKKFKTDFSLSDTTISDKLPMNLGPQTPADRNQFFSNGYTATADLTTVFNINIVGAKLTGKSSTDRVKEKKVDFIVPDVSIKDSYGV